MTYTRRSLDVVLAERAAAKRQSGAFCRALVRALATPPDPYNAAFKQMFADTIKQQEKRR